MPFFIIGFGKPFSKEETEAMRQLAININTFLAELHCKLLKMENRPVSPQMLYSTEQMIKCTKEAPDVIIPLWLLDSFDLYSLAKTAYTVNGHKEVFDKELHEFFTKNSELIKKLAENELMGKILDEKT